MKVALISALPWELKPAFKHLEAERKLAIYGFKIVLASHGENKIILGSSGIGKVNMSIFTGMLALKFNIEAAVLIGTLGSAAPRLRIGELLIPDTIAFYDQCLETDLGSIHFLSYDKLARSIKGFKPSRDVFEALIKASASLGVKCVRGTLLTMDKFMAKSSALRDIRMNVRRSIVGVDMESAAFAQACERFKVRYGIVKVATDMVGPAAPVQFIINFRRLAPLPAHVALKAIDIIGSQGKSN